MLRAAIQATASADGLVTREGVVAAASDPDNPLHADEGFLWGQDDEAARRYRLEHAGKLIRRVHFIVRTRERRRARVPCFVRSPHVDEQEPGHVALRNVPPASGSAMIVVRDELRRVVGILARAARVSEALAVPEVSGELVRLHMEAAQALAGLDGLREPVTEQVGYVA